MITIFNRPSGMQKLQTKCMSCVRESHNECDGYAVDIVHVECHRHAVDVVKYGEVHVEGPTKGKATAKDGSMGNIILTACKRSTCSSCPVHLVINNGFHFRSYFRRTP